MRQYNLRSVQTWLAFLVAVLALISLPTPPPAEAGGARS